MVYGPCSPDSLVSSLPSNWDPEPAIVGHFLPFLHPDTYPCISQPLELELEEDLLQHWNAVQSLPPSLEIFGVRGHKSQ